jgi:hypothetical protein
LGYHATDVDAFFEASELIPVPFSEVEHEEDEKEKDEDEDMVSAAVYVANSSCKCGHANREPPVLVGADQQPRDARLHIAQLMTTCTLAIAASATLRSSSASTSPQRTCSDLLRH